MLIGLNRSWFEWKHEPLKWSGRSSLDLHAINSANSVIGIGNLAQQKNGWFSNFDVGETNTWDIRIKGKTRKTPCLIMPRDTPWAPRHVQNGAQPGTIPHAAKGHGQWKMFVPASKEGIQPTQPK
jgi:hypothetical protein